MIHCRVIGSKQGSIRLVQLFGAPYDFEIKENQKKSTIKLKGKPRIHVHKVLFCVYFVHRV